jgi:tRNA A37 threonylcarbamoyladenosine synthetase subunit TsaC/SUA5/YrdC
MTLNTATGIASGTPSSNGTFQLVLSASGDGGTSTSNYTLVVREQPTLAWDNPGGHVSLRMPVHPVTLAVLAATGPLAVTSAQRAGSAPPRTCADAEGQLGDGIALYLDAGPTTDEVPSSIVDLTVEPPVLLREGAYSLDALVGICPDLVLPEA